MFDLEIFVDGHWELICYGISKESCKSVAASFLELYPELEIILTKTK